MADDYDDLGSGPVGYGRPPVHSQFKKGQSGNPRGRPKGSKNLRTLMDEEFQKKVSLPVNGKIRKIPKGEVVAKMWTNQLMQGDHRAREQYLKMELADIASSGSYGPEEEEIHVFMEFDGEEKCVSCGNTCGPGLMSVHDCPHRPKSN